MLLDALTARIRSEPRNATTIQTLAASGIPIGSFESSAASTAMKLSAVNRCIEVLSDSMSKLPVYAFDSKTRERISHPLHRLLSVRPNEAMTPSVRKKLLEANRLIHGNAYEWIIRDPRSLHPVELLPIPSPLVRPWRDTKGHVWYDISHPYTGEIMRLNNQDVAHYKAFSHDGLLGISVLARAAEVIAAGRAAQAYDAAFYLNGAQPSGILKVDADLSSKVSEVTDEFGNKSYVSKKDVIRKEWEKCHAGPQNSFRVTIADLGMTYQPLSISNVDAQFVEREELSVQDISRFFGVPLYKLQAGKQSYQSNEQNAIDYVVSILHPAVAQYEEEQTWKLLPDSEINAGIELRINMMAELKGDTRTRGAWYRNQREIGAFSANDILRLEDMPDVDGGDEHYASLNYVPLSLFRELSLKRNGGKKP